MLDLPAIGGSAAHLTPREKAAVVVRLLLVGGALPELSQLSEEDQAELVLQIGRMKPVDRATVQAVADEFAAEIENIGVSFPADLEDALGMLDGVISPAASSRVRQTSADSFRGDPWEQVSAVDEDRLVAVIEREAIEIGAVIMSKLPVKKAAAILGRMPGERARRITYSISLSGSVSPATVRSIGVSLAEELGTRPARAFSDGPVDRVGAILNQSPSLVRDEILEGLDREDHDFAEQVKRAIFTFANIKDRLSPRDVPRVHRELEQADIARAIAFAQGNDAESVEFILANISQRMADMIRAEAEELGTVPLQEAEASMRAIVEAIRALESEGEISLIAEDG